MKLQKDDKIDIDFLLENGYIKNIADLIGDQEPSKLFPFLVKKYGYLLNGDLLSDKEIEFRRRMHQIIKKIGPLALSNKHVFENRNTLINPNDLTPDKKIIVPDEPVIWMANHGFKDDVLASGLSVTRNAYVFFASLPQFYNTIDGFTAWLNGVCMVNRKVDQSKKDSVQRCADVLNHGVDLIVYPEGILNKSMNEIMLPFWAGIYRTSKETGAKIIPMVHYLRDKSRKSLMRKLFPTEDDIIHTVIDDPIRIDDLSEKAAIEYLRDVMATWLWLLMERYGQTTHENLLNNEASALNAWEVEVQKIKNSMDFYDSEIELTADYQPKDITRPEEVWKSIADIKSTPQNVADVVYASNLVRQRTKENIQRRF